MFLKLYIASKITLLGKKINQELLSFGAESP